jgi:hypothetical protein
MVKIGCRLQSKLDPVRSLGSLGVHNRVRRMHQTFAGDDRSRQMEIKFFVSAARIGAYARVTSGLDIVIFERFKNHHVRW